MPNTSVSLVNAALRALGHPVISSLTASSSPITLSLFNELLEEVLVMAPWGAATSRAVLPLLNKSPLFGFKYAHALPPNCLRVLSIYGEETAWRIEGKALLSDELIVKIIYTRHISDISVLPPYLRAVVSAHIAIALASTLTKSMAVTRKVENDMARALSDARYVDVLQQGNEEDQSWIDSML